jgi:uncharacterized membrane protein
MKTFNELLTWHDRWFAATIVAMLGIGGYFATRLPETIATHWNAAGQVDGLGSPLFTVFFPPAMAVFMWLVLMLAPLGDPLCKNLIASKEAYGETRLAVVLFAAALQAALIGSNYYPWIMPGAVPFAIGLLFVVIGRNMPRVGRNHTMGIRLPSTLASDRVWELTHRKAGKYFVYAGVASAAGAMLPPFLSFIVLMASSIMAVVGSLVAAHRASRS